MFNNFFSLIPRRVHSRTIIRFFEFLRKAESFFSRSYEDHLSSNEKRLPSHEKVIQDHSGYIEDQQNYTDFSYGRFTLKYSGCEVIAVYNALRDLLGSAPMNLARLAAHFERDGMVLFGRFGTSPKALSDFLNQQGFEAELCTDHLKFESTAALSRSIILTFFNDVTDIRKQVHTVHISKDASGYIAHNVYGNGSIVGPAASLSELIENINHGKAHPISLIGINSISVPERK